MCDPTVLITWNANGATPRAKDDSIISAFIEEHKPDVLFVQEVRLRATSPYKRDVPAKLKKASTTEIASSLFVGDKYSNYIRHFSLADKKISGTMILVNKNIEHKVYNSWHSALLSHGAEPDSISVFSPELHHPEGRVQYISFASFDCLHTYVPNSGNTEESMERRESWDSSIEIFLKMRSDLTERPIMWVGDLNVAQTSHDLTDEAFFIRENQPGYQEKERTRFSQLIKNTDLIDVWRFFHPIGKTTPLRETNSFTWRGAMRAKDKRFPAKFEGKAMRLDYFLVHSYFPIHRIESCEILGDGVQRNGFLGSDHCPIKLILM